MKRGSDSGSGPDLKPKKIPTFFFDQKYETQNYDLILFISLFIYINQRSIFINNEIFLCLWQLFSLSGSIFTFYDTDPDPDPQHCYSTKNRGAGDAMV